jgi:hypothetical protein
MISDRLKKSYQAAADVAYSWFQRCAYGYAGHADDDVRAITSDDGASCNDNGAVI